MTTRTALRRAAKESIVRKFLASHWNQRLVYNFVYNVEGCLHSISDSILNSVVAGTRLPTWKFNSRLISKIELLRSLNSNPPELRSFAAYNLTNRDFFCYLFSDFCHSQSRYSVSKKPIGPLAISKVNMEKMDEEPSFENNSENVESSVKIIQTEASTDVTEDVTGVNQKGITANQDNFDMGSFTQEKGPSDLEHEIKSDQFSSKEPWALEAGDGACASKDDDLSPKGKKKPVRIIPNYFLAIRVSNPQIHSGVKIIQDSITTHNEKLTPALIPLATLHLTLMVMHLEDAEQIQKATEVLNQCRTSVEPILLNSALKLTFSGLDHFHHQVLYVKLFGEEQMEVLKSVVNIVRETFTKEGIPSTDSREFNPHLTVMKLSRDPKLRKKGIKKIPEESYASWVDMSFGEEPVNALHLCSMNKKEKDGFYKCAATLIFDDAATESSPDEPESAITEDIAAKDNQTGDASMVQETTNARTAPCDEENVNAGENIEENVSCDEDLSKEIVTWTVDENMEDSVMNKQSSDVQGDYN